MTHILRTMVSRICICNGLLSATHVLPRQGSISHTPSHGKGVSQTCDPAARDISHMVSHGKGASPIVTYVSVGPDPFCCAPCRTYDTPRQGTCHTWPPTAREHLTMSRVCRLALCYAPGALGCGLNRNRLCEEGRLHLTWDHLYQLGPLCIVCASPSIILRS